LTQGSQSLALGLTLAAAPQLVEGGTTTGYSLGCQVCHYTFVGFGQATLMRGLAGTIGK